MREVGALFFFFRVSFTFTRLLLGAYWARKREAVLHPESTLSVIIDGSDQVNNGCPYYSEKTHAMDGKWKFRLHIYGVLVHGYSPFVYLLQNHVKQGTIGVFLELSSYLLIVRLFWQEPMLPLNVLSKLCIVCNRTVLNYLPILTCNWITRASRIKTGLFSFYIRFSSVASYQHGHYLPYCLLLFALQLLYFHFSWCVVTARLKFFLNFMYLGRHLIPVFSA